MSFPDSLTYYEKLSDRKLLDCIIHHDEQAVEYLLYVKCKPMFTRIIRQIFSSQIEMNELISEFYLYLQYRDWAKLKTFHGDSALMTWLTVIAVRFFVNNCQRLTNLTARNTLNLDEAMNDLQTVFSNHASNSFSKYELYDAINHIKNPRYKWVILSELNGMNPEEMSVELHTTIHNIYNLKKRAKIQLAELLNEWKNV